MDEIFVGRPLVQWLVALGGALCLIGVIRLVRWRLNSRLLVGAPDNTLRSLLARMNARWLRLTTLLLALSVAALLLDPPSRGVHIVRVTLVIALGIQVAWLLPTLMDWLLLRFLPQRVLANGGAASSAESRAASVAATLTGLRWLILLVAYSVLLLLALQNVGVDVTAMVASLGIGGIAIALAVQNILSDLFASLTITLDRPFVRGDFIVVGSEMGEVEHVGLKTTRVRSLSGEELVFGNTDLLESRIRNYKRMAQRRVVFQLRVPLNTPAEELEAIPPLVREAIQSRPELRFDRSHLAQFGEDSFDFESVYYVNSADYNLHMDALQSVLLSIVRAFSARRIEFAVPSQTLRVPELEAIANERRSNRSRPSVNRTKQGE